MVGPFRSDFALAYSQLGLVLASYGLARFLSNVPAGALMRRFGLRPILLAGLVVNLSAAVLPIASTAVWHVVVARIVQGMTSAIAQAAILAWLVIGAQPAVRGRVMALSEAFFSITGLVVPIGTGAVAALMGWRAAFVVATIAATCALCAILFGTHSNSVPSTISASGAERASASRLSVWRILVLGGRPLVAAFLLSFIVAFNRQAIMTTLLPLIGSDQIGLTPLQVGFALTMLNLIGIGMLMVGGWAGDRFGRRQLTAPGIAVVLACQAALFLVLGPAMYFVAVAIQGLGFAINSFAPGLVGDALPPDLRSVGVAGHRLLVDGGVLLAPTAVGFAIDLGGFRTAEIMVMAVTAAILVLALLTTLRPGVARPGPERLQSR